MKLAVLPSLPLPPTRPSSAPVGRLVVVSSDLRRAVDASGIVPDLVSALTRWEELEPSLRSLSIGLERGELVGFGFEPGRALAPLPRAPQLLWAAAFPAQRLHLEATPGPAGPGERSEPLMERLASDDLRGPTEDIDGHRVDEWIDISGGFGVVGDAVPSGTGPTDAATHIRLVTLVNRITLRRHQRRESAAGSGMINSVPMTTFAPVVVTPDELAWWHGHRLHRRLLVSVNGHPFARPDGGAMEPGFDELVAYGARTRDLSPGTIIASGTAASADPEEGSASIAGRRGIELARHGQALTPFLGVGDRVRLDVLDDEAESVFGPIDQVCLPDAIP